MTAHSMSPSLTDRADLKRAASACAGVDLSDAVTGVLIALFDGKHTQKINVAEFLQTMEERRSAMDELRGKERKGRVWEFASCFVGR